VADAKAGDRRVVGSLVRGDHPKGDVSARGIERSPSAPRAGLVSVGVVSVGGTKLAAAASERATRT
jgi:hypothetical protein